MTTSRKHYSGEFKRQAVARLTGDPAQLAAVADELGVSRSCLYDWRKQFSDIAPSASAEKPPGSAASLHQPLLDTAFALAGAIRQAAESAPLNQLSAALGLIMARLHELEASASAANSPDSDQVIRIEYQDPDGSIHLSPPWARGDPAFEAPIVRGRVRSPFWDSPEDQVDPPGDED